MTAIRSSGSRLNLGKLIGSALLAAACGQSAAAPEGSAREGGDPSAALRSTTSPSEAPDAPAVNVERLQHRRVCDGSGPGVRCHALVRLNQFGELEPSLVPAGLSPADLKAAYKLPATGGAGVTIGIVDAMDAPNAEADLAVYRAQYGLPPCTTANGCFKKINQRGAAAPLPTADPSWGAEILLDIEMASAVCPSCKILLVEASAPTMQDLGAAVNAAVAAGANVVSNSWGGGESPSDPSSTSAYFNHPGVLITVSSGDGGYGVSYPASASTVLAVGGTSLSRSTNARGWAETVWGSATNAHGGAGSGCSAYSAKPSWQKDTGCARRTVADVSAVADPQTGVSVYDSAVGGWLVFGGTSVSSPVVAAIFALTGHASATAQYPYSNPTFFNDVVGGTNGACGGGYLCTGLAGFDGPTGLGTPNAAAMVTAAPAPANGFLISAGAASVVAGASATAAITTATTSGSAQVVTLAISGAPAGVTAAIAPASVTSGGGATVTLAAASTVAPGSYALTLTGTAASGAHTATLALVVTAPACKTASQLLGNPGFETNGSWTASAGVLNTDTSLSAPRTGLGDAWLDGYGASRTDTLSQTVTIPANACSASLTFWLKVLTNRSTSQAALDRLTVTANTTTLGTFSNLNRGAAYAQQTFDLSAFKGKAVTIGFTGVATSTLSTSFVIDDAAVNVVQ